MHTCMYACVSRQASLFCPDVFSLPPSFLPASLPQPVPTTYLTDFKKAYLTFQHQRVYDPERECLVTLKPLPPGLQVCVVWGLGACDMCRYADISICMCDMYVCLHICTYPPTHTHTDRRHAIYWHRPLPRGSPGYIFRPHAPLHPSVLGGRR